MFTSMSHFLTAWQHESTQTARLMAELTDAALSRRVADGHRSLRELAWHITVSQRGIVGATGLEYEAPTKNDPAPLHASEICAAYVAAAAALGKAVARQWTDQTLRVKDKLYGMTWPRGLTLLVMLSHEIHHRGQMTVLMRQAGLKVPGIYGPSKDEE